MISALKGVVKVVDKQIIEIQADNVGISFALSVPQNVAVEVGKPIEVVTYMHWNQDTGPSMFGFSSLAQREMFIIVLSCSGVGPKMALSLLNQLSPDQLIQAVTQHDFKTLSSVNGIGPKKAEQIVLQLHSKIKRLTSLPGQASEGAQHWNNVSQALTSLNYSRPEIMQTMAHLREENIKPNVEFDALMRQALAFLSKKV
ncbi:Holliday junction branch migration protein RuvA [bacterium]|jgi:holliday junction DNA helicase RuvA|nr:Holliday junction branch migration protein RuvA [bacterium]MBT5015028.1 Holliday junction branch migration protein RuvA [bacterium]